MTGRCPVWTCWLQSASQACSFCTACRGQAWWEHPQRSAHSPSVHRHPSCDSSRCTCSCSWRRSDTCAAQSGGDASTGLLSGSDPAPAHPQALQLSCGLWGTRARPGRGCSWLSASHDMHACRAHVRHHRVACGTSRRSCKHDLPKGSTGCAAAGSQPFVICAPAGLIQLRPTDAGRRTHQARKLRTAGCPLQHSPRPPLAGHACRLAWPLAPQAICTLVPCSPGCCSGCWHACCTTSAPLRPAQHGHAQQAGGGDDPLGARAWQGGGRTGVRVMLAGRLGQRLSLDIAAPAWPPMCRWKCL